MTSLKARNALPHAGHDSEPKEKRLWLDSIDISAPVHGPPRETTTAIDCQWPSGLISLCGFPQSTIPTHYLKSARSGPKRNNHSVPMSNHYNPSLEDRLNLSAEAKKNLLAKFKKHDPNSPEAIEKRRQREAIVAARAERMAQREAERLAHEAELARQAETAAAAAAEAARLAAEQEAVEAAARAEAEAELRAQQKAARDARYAARKSAIKKKRRRGY